MTWIDVLRAKRRDLFSSLNRERVALDLIKDLIVLDLLTCKPVSRRQNTAQLVGVKTVTMPTERIEER